MKKYSGSISTGDYEKAIRTLTDNQKKILTLLYHHGSFDDSNKIAEALGYKSFVAANLHIGNIGKKVANSLDIDIDSLPPYEHPTGDRPSYYLLIHGDVYNDGKWSLQKNLKTAIEAILPVRYIYQLPVFTVCKAAGETSPTQILLAKDDTQYTVFSTERDGMIMTAFNKSVSKKVRVAILETPTGQPGNLSDCRYKLHEALKTKAITLLYKQRDENKLSQQALSVIQAIENTNRSKESSQDVRMF